MFQDLQLDLNLSSTFLSHLIPNRITLISLTSSIKVPTVGNKATSLSPKQVVVEPPNYLTRRQKKNFTQHQVLDNTRTKARNRNNNRKKTSTCQFLSPLPTQAAAVPKVFDVSKTNNS